MLVFCSGMSSVLSVGILPSLFQNNIADQWLAINCDKSLGCTRRKTWDASFFFQSKSTPCVWRYSTRKD